MPTLQQKRGTTAALQAVNPTPLAGEIVWDSTTNTLRVGDGVTAYSSLSVVSATPTDGSVTTAKLANDAVTYAKLQNVSATDRLLGRSSVGAGDVEEILCGSFGRSLIGSAGAAAARSTLSVQPTASPAFTGAATVTNDGNVVPLTVTNTGTANSFVVNDASGDTTPFVIDASGRVVIGGTAASSEGDVVSVINAAAATGNVSRLFVARASAPSSSTSAHNGFQSSIGTDAASFTVSALRHFIATQGTLGAGSSVTDQYGFAALSTITGATNNYGFYSDIASGTGRWNFYANGTAANYFAGQMLVGTTSAFNANDGVQIAAAANAGIIIARTAAPASTNSISGINSTAYDGSAYVAGATINFRAAENWSSTNHGTDIQFRTTPTGSGGALTETLRLTGSGQLLVTAGSVSACGVAFSGDTNTGLAQIGGADTASLVTAGVERVRVDASGNVGIGISPSTLLHLNSLGVLRLQTGSVTMDCTPTAGATDSFVWNTSANAAYRWSMNGTERMRIESDGKLYAYNTYGTTVGATNRDLFIDSGGLIGYVSSIRASKTGITAIDDVSWLRDLTPVSFHYRKRNADGTYSDEPDGTLDYGLIAEDVEPVAPELCFYDVVDGEPQLRGVHYSKLITPMLRYIQQLEARIAALEERIDA